jgi:hypothetical protein
MAHAGSKEKTYINDWDTACGNFKTSSSSVSYGQPQLFAEIARSHDLRAIPEHLFFCNIYFILAESLIFVPSAVNAYTCDICNSQFFRAASSGNTILCSSCL